MAKQSKIFNTKTLIGILTPIIAITLALVVGGIILYVFIGVNPFSVYKIIFTKALGDRAGLGEVLYRATPLIFTGLAVALAFQCGLFNIGGEGQMVMGGFAITWVGFTFTGLPGFLLIPGQGISMRTIKKLRLPCVQSLQKTKQTISSIFHT